MKSIAAISKPKAFWQVNPARVKPMPFPGRYPTRWRLTFFSVNNPKKVLWRYDGKPDFLIARKVDSFCKKSGTMWLTEYDKGGVFRHTWQNTPRKAAFTVYSLNTLAQFYYPWRMELSGEEFFHAWRKGVHHKMIVDRGRKFFVYSHIREMLLGEANIQMLREYRTWLRKINPSK